jgi:hypothetical protein
MDYPESPDSVEKVLQLTNTFGTSAQVRQLKIFSFTLPEI